MTEEKHARLILVRGGGDIATGTIARLFRAGFPLLVLETDKPSAIRRQLSHVPQGSAVGPCSQFSAFARILAVLVFPVPRGPEKR